jgi:metal-responsive CopG/Arc/MetJ family transcriptional regulator
MTTKKNNVVGIRLSDDELKQLDGIMMEEGFVSRNAVIYKAIFEFLRSKRLEKSGHRIVYEGTVEPRKQQ